MTMSSALAIDGAAMANTPRAAITYPNFFMLSSSVKARTKRRIRKNVPEKSQENSERLLSQEHDPDAKSRAMKRSSPLR
jgi:hypothetical protein